LFTKISIVHQNFHFSPKFQFSPKFSFLPKFPLFIKIFILYTKSPKIVFYSNPIADKKLIPISLCEFSGSYQIRRHGECGKKWSVKGTFYVHNKPTPGTQLIYIGSRDSKPWDSRASLKPLDGTPFTRNNFTMYAETEENIEVQG